jgi:DNA-binding transcriptional LysR family regulator
MAQTAVSRDAFAELLAEGRSITQAAKELGKNQQWGSLRMKEIRERLGWQAQ